MGMFFFYGMLLILVLGVILYVVRFFMWLRKPKDWRDYEFYVANELTKDGFERCIVTKARADGGYDIVAYKGGKKWLVSVKKYSKNVGVKDVREILGVAFEKKGFPMLVTTKGFSKEAERFARATQVELRVMPIDF